MKDSTHTLVFAAVLGLVCSILLAATSRFTAPYSRANEKAEEVRNFLRALDVPFDPGADARTLLGIFEKNVRVAESGDLQLYKYIPASSGSDEPVSVAVPVSGPGLWGPIRAVVAFEPDMTTIRGVRFYKQEETPGLGGEIGSEWFQKQFGGKRIVSPGGTPGFRIGKPGTKSDINSVDGITGATMTSDRVEDMLDALAKRMAGGGQQQ